MSKSIISENKVCFVCGNPNVVTHHIYEGYGRRKLSDKYGCIVYLCPYHHNTSDYGVHFNKTLDLELKQKCQTAWEQKYGTREEFIKTFTRSYL